MEILIGAGVVFVWLSLGFGTRAVFVAAKHNISDFPLLVLIWPVPLMIAAYVTQFMGDSQV